MSLHPPTPEEQAAISASNCVPLTRKITSTIDLSADRALTQDNIPDGTTYKQYNPAAVAVTGGTATGLTVNGLILPDVANNFDPSVSGLTPRLAATVGTIDGTKAWVKTGTATTDWEPIHST
jgi:hypothetical protein